MQKRCWFDQTLMPPRTPVTWSTVFYICPNCGMHYLLRFGELRLISPQAATR